MGAADTSPIDTSPRRFPSRLRWGLGCLVLVLTISVTCSVVLHLRNARDISAIISALEQNGVGTVPLTPLPITQSRPTGPVYLIADLRGWNRYGISIPTDRDTADNLRLIAELAERGRLESISFYSTAVASQRYLLFDEAFRNDESTESALKRLRAAAPQMQVYVFPAAKSVVSTTTSTPTAPSRGAIDDDARD